MSAWRQPARTPEAQAAYAAAEADRQARPERFLLDAGHIAAVAAGDGTTEHFAEGWRVGLEHYVSSARDDGRLNALGTAMAASTAVSRLRAGATMAQHLAEHPDVVARPILPPIVIIGGWRTGTTFLFRLLATDPRLRGPLPSELADPTRAAQLAGDDRERFIDASSRAHDMLHFLSPQMQAIHDSGPRLPEECVLAMGSDFRNWGFTSTVRLDGYAAWLAGQDLGGSYARYRRVLQVLDQGDGRRWVVKAPAHTAELPHVASAFPGAIVVQLHRDIVETVASGSSLFAVFRSMYSDQVDGADVGRYQTDTTELWLRRAKAFRDDPASRAVTFVDLDFPGSFATRSARSARSTRPPAWNHLPTRPRSSSSTSPRSRGTRTGHTPTPQRTSASTMRRSASGSPGSRGWAREISPSHGRRCPARALVDAAATIVDTAGFAAVSIEQVAAMCDVTRTVVYQHFGSLDGLIDAVDADPMTWRMFLVAPRSGPTALEDRLAQDRAMIRQHNIGASQGSGRLADPELTARMLQVVADKLVRLRLADPAVYTVERLLDQLDAVGRAILRGGRIRT